MSYHLDAYLIKGKKLEMLMRGKGSIEPILKDIESEVEAKDFAQRLDEGFAEDHAEGCPTAKEALQTLVKGEAQQVTEWEYMYGYALQLLCETYGIALNNEGFEAVTSVEFLVDLEVFSYKVLNFRVYDDFWAMPPALPLPLSEYPMIGFLPLDKAPQLASKFDQLNLEHPEFGEALTTVRTWVDHMLMEKQDLITFFY